MGDEIADAGLRGGDGGGVGDLQIDALDIEQILSVPTAVQVTVYGPPALPVTVTV